VAGLVERWSSAGGVLRGGIGWRDGMVRSTSLILGVEVATWSASAREEPLASKADRLRVQARGELLPVALSREKEPTTRAGSGPTRARSGLEGLGCCGCMDVCLELATTMAGSPGSVLRYRGLQILVGLEVEDGLGPQPCRVSEATALRI
jgi:hypothetical protein